MSKITNDGLTRSGTECFIAVIIWQQWASKGSANAVGMRMMRIGNEVCYKMNESGAGEPDADER